jgi:hypothetical protein
MSAEHADDARVHGGRPNVSGDLPEILSSSPMFRRSVAGYDRFQVDTYVRWAEDELAIADREREHLVERHVRTRASLDEARELLTHTSSGGEFIRLSHRLGSMLAAAADEAEGMRAEAQADRAAAAEQARQTAAKAEQMLADTEAEAERALAEAAVEVAERLAEAGRIVDDAELTRREARTEADARLTKVALIEQRTAEQADAVRRAATADAAASLLQARDEVVRLLTTGRDQRQRADDEAAAIRRRQDQDAVLRRTALLAEISDLEHRRTRLRAEVRRLARQAEQPAGTRLDVAVARIVGRVRWGFRALRTH